MQPTTTTTATESIPLLHSPSSPLLGYSLTPNTGTLIFASHIDFNGKQIAHDRNLQAFQVCFTGSGGHGVIGLRGGGVQVIDLRTGGVIVGRGVQIGDGVLGVSVQDQTVKTGVNSRRVYMILQHSGKVYLKVIQIESQTDNDPKTKIKPIQLTAATPPSFSCQKWNLFLVINRDSLRVCRPVNRNNEIEFDFSLQNLQPNLQQFCSTNTIICMAESMKTWALLCGSSQNSRQQTQMSLNIFKLHCSGNELTRTMYCRDDSFIKAVSLPCTSKEYLRMWQTCGFYIVESWGGRAGSHCCHVVSEELEFGTVSIRMSDHSIVCDHSLAISAEEISLCEIVNFTQLNKIRVYEKQVVIPSTQPTQASSQSQPTQSPRTETQPIQNRQQVQLPVQPQPQPQSQPQPSQSIKKFEPVPEVAKPKIEWGKATARKGEIQPPNDEKVGQSQNLVNDKLVDLLKSSEGRKHSSDEDLEVPTQIQNLISFGAPGKIQEKPHAKQISNPTLISFARPPPQQQQKKPQKPTVPSPPVAPKTQQKSPKTQKKIIPKQKVEQIYEQFNALTKNMMDQLAERRQSLKKSYHSLGLNQMLRFEPVFTNQESVRLQAVEKNIRICELQLKRRRIEKERRDRMATSIENRIQRIRKLLGELQYQLDLQDYENVSFGRLNLGKPKKRPLTWQVHMRSVKQATRQIEQIEKQADLKVKTYEKKLKRQIERNKMYQVSTNLVTKLISGQQEPLIKPALRVPIPQRFSVTKMKPLIKLNPL